MLGVGSSGLVSRRWRLTRVSFEPSLAHRSAGLHPLKLRANGRLVVLHGRVFRWECLVCPPLVGLTARMDVVPNVDDRDVAVALFVVAYASLHAKARREALQSRARA